MATAVLQTRIDTEVKTEATSLEAKHISKDSSVKSYSSAKELLKYCD